MENDAENGSAVWNHARQAIVAATILIFCADVAAQTIAPSSGPDGRSPESAPGPAASSTSPGSSSAPSTSPSSPAPETRATSPGTRPEPPGSPRPTAGVPPRVVAPDAPVPSTDSLDPTDAVAPSDQSLRVRRATGAPGTRVVPRASDPDSMPMTAPAAPATPLRPD